MTKKQLINYIQKSSMKRGINLTKTEAEQSAVDNGFIKNGELTNRAKNIRFTPLHKGQKPSGYIHINKGIQVINKLFK